MTLNSDKKKITKVYERLKEEFPEQEPKSYKGDPLDILIAAILSQNTNDKLSHRAYLNLRRKYKKWDDLLSDTLLNVKKEIRVCGLENAKSRSIRAILSDLKKRHDKISLKYLKEMSDQQVYEELTKYKGVGNKTAALVLIFCLGRDAFPVDTHIHRISNRLKISESTIPDKTFEQLKNKIPEGIGFHLHTLMLKFGRKICRPSKPYCNICPLYDLCCFVYKKQFSDFHNQSLNSEPRDNSFIVLENL